MSIRIGFIGAGNMAEALIGGLISKKIFSKNEIIACAPSLKTREHIEGVYGVKMYEKAADVVDKTNMVVIAVKPKNVDGLFSEEHILIGKGQTVISIVAGLTLDKMNSYVPDAKKVRVMPNHCCMVLEGAMGFACDPSMTNSEKSEVAKILSSVGLASEVPESKMEAVTAVAGSSPAFYYMVVDAIANAGVKNGLTREESLQLAAQSMLGAAKMVLETGKEPDRLREEVCSPGGTTIEGVKILQKRDINSVMTETIDRTVERAVEMSRE